MVLILGMRKKFFNGVKGLGFLLGVFFASQVHEFENGVFGNRGPGPFDQGLGNLENYRSLGFFKN